MNSQEINEIDTRPVPSGKFTVTYVEQYIHVHADGTMSPHARRDEPLEPIEQILARWRTSSKRFDSEEEAQIYADGISPSRFARVVSCDDIEKEATGVAESPGTQESGSFDSP